MDPITTAPPHPALASQAAFRAVMEAFARPGEVRTIEGIAAPQPFAPATAALVRSLADYETPVWLDAALIRDPAVAEWIRFHTGAPLARAPADAAFALIGDLLSMPDFTQFALGSEEYPDRSTTVILQVAGFTGRSFAMRGPGIREEATFAAEPLPEDFSARLAANRELFPRGVDLILVAGSKVVALPRSVRLQRQGH